VSDQILVWCIFVLHGSFRLFYLATVSEHPYIKHLLNVNLRTLLVFSLLFLCSYSKTLNIKVFLIFYLMQSERGSIHFFILIRDFFSEDTHLDLAFIKSVL